MTTLTAEQTDRTEQATRLFRRGFEYALTTTGKLGLTGLWDLPENAGLIYWEIGALHAGYMEGRRHRHLIGPAPAEPGRHLVG